MLMAYQYKILYYFRLAPMRGPALALVRRLMLGCTLLECCLCVTPSASGQELWEKSRRAGADARNQGRYGEARHWLEQARAQAAFEPADLRRADLDDELAGVCQVLGDDLEAERLYTDAQAVLARHPSDGDDVRAIVLGGLGLFRMREGRLTDAEVVLNTALSSGKKAFGERDVRMATVQSSIAQLYLVKGEASKAEPLLQTAIEVQRKGASSSARDLLISEGALGTMYLMEGRYPEAESTLTDAQNAARRFGDSPPELAGILASLADVYRLEGRASRGEPLLKQAQAIYTTAFGADSPRVAEILLDRSIDDLSANKAALAEDVILQALGILRRVNGPEHTAVALGELRLAEAYKLERKYTEAEQLLNHALAVQERTYPQGHQLVADTLIQMAEVQRLQNHFPEAEISYRRAIAGYEKIGALNTPNLAFTLRQYAKLLKTSRAQEAKALERRAEGMRSAPQAFQ
jgi:tetratricopeptide (TPR) repeat protein